MRPSDARRCEDTDTRRSHPGEARNKNTTGWKKKIICFWCGRLKHTSHPHTHTAFGSEWRICHSLLNPSYSDSGKKRDVMVSVTDRGGKSIIRGRSGVIPCEPEWAAVKQQESRSLHGSQACFIQGLPYLLKVKPVAQKWSFEWPFSVIYRLAPFLSSTLPAPDPSSCLPPPLSHAFWVKCTYFPLICFHGNQTNVLRLECVFVTHILRPKKCAAGWAKKERKLLTFFSDAPLRPPSPQLFPSPSPSFSLSQSCSLYLFLPFPLLFWPAAGNLIKQGVSWTIAEGERLVVAGTDKTSQDCGCLEWTGCGYMYAGRCVQLIQGKQCPAVSLLQLGYWGIRVVKEHSGVFGSYWVIFSVFWSSLQESIGCDSHFNYKTKLKLFVSKSMRFCRMAPQSIQKKGGGHSNSFTNEGTGQKGLIND